MAGAHLSFHMHEGDTMFGYATVSKETGHRWFVLDSGAEVSLTIHYDRGNTKSVVETLRKVANQVENHERMQPTTEG